MAGNFNAAHTKGFFFHGALPHFLNEEQRPQSKRPFTTVEETQWAHTMHLVCPTGLADSVQQRIEAFSSELKYAKVMMSLSDLLTGDFFNDYIKQGNVSMLSEGRPGVDNNFSLHAGVLRLEMDRPTYERTGLVGSVIPDGGSKHKKSRFYIVIEFNLRSPSMLRGKSGFKRLAWAAKNVLNTTLTWLFFDHVSPDPQSRDRPVGKHHPLWTVIEPQWRTTRSVLSQDLVLLLYDENDQATFKDGEYMLELEEWLALIKLGSLRATGTDDVDPYICRYQLPGALADKKTSESGTELAILRLHGFLPSSLIMKVLSLMLNVGKAQWSSLSFETFQGDSCTVLQLQAGKGSQAYLEWDRRLSR